MKNMRCAIEGPQNDYIWYADKPPRLGGVPYKRSVAEVEALLNFTYTESIWTNLSPNSIQTDASCVNPRAASRFKEYLSHLPLDKFVLCKINQTLGHGLFAREKIEMGEMLPYAGILENDLVSTNNRYIFENKGTNSLSTNALIAGGLSRFIQHAPINIKKDADKLARLTQDVIFRNQYLKRIEFQESMTYAIPRTSDEIFSDMQRTKNPERKLANFEYTSIKFTDTKTELKTAWANIVVSYSIINKTPIVMFIAESDIQSGEQILVSYGLGNLIGQEIYPELFKLDGSVVLHDLYYRDKILVTCTIQNNNQNLIYQRDTFLKYDIQRDSPTPIAVFPGQYPFSSTFFLRKELVRANALTEEYKALPAPSAVIHLQRIFGDLDIKVECFYRDPKMNADPNHALNQVVDIVLSAKNRITWTYLYLLFENIKFHCKRFEHTNEVIILGANTVPSELMTFISLLLKLRRSIHFNETPVIPEKRPDDIHIISYFFQQQGRPKTPDTFNEACMCGDYKISFQ